MHRWQQQPWWNVGHGSRRHSTHTACHVLPAACRCQRRGGAHDEARGELWTSPDADSTTGTASSVPGRIRSGSAPIVARFTSYQPGHEAAISCLLASAPRCAAAIDHSVSPGATVTVVDGGSDVGATDAGSATEWGGATGPVTGPAARSRLRTVGAPVVGVAPPFGSPATVATVTPVRGSVKSPVGPSPSGSAVDGGVGRAVGTSAGAASSSEVARSPPSPCPTCDVDGASGCTVGDHAPERSGPGPLADDASDTIASEVAGAGGRESGEAVPGVDTPTGVGAGDSSGDVAVSVVTVHPRSGSAAPAGTASPRPRPAESVTARARRTTRGVRRVASASARRAERPARRARALMARRPQPSASPAAASVPTAMTAAPTAASIDNGCWLTTERAAMASPTAPAAETALATADRIKPGARVMAPGASILCAGSMVNAPCGRGRPDVV